MKKKNEVKIDQEDLIKAKEWAEQVEAPSFVKNIIQAIGSVENSANPTKATKALADALVRAMGMVPSSERVPKQKEPVVPVDDELAKLLKSEKQLRSLLRYVSRKLGSVREKIVHTQNAHASQTSSDDSAPIELVLSGQAGNKKSKSEHPATTQEFNDMGADSIKSKITRTKNDLVMHRDCHEMTLDKIYNPNSGKTLIPDTSLLGPKGSQITWRAIANVMVLVFGMAMPTARIEKLFGTSGFSRSSISDYCALIASRLLPVYIAMAEALAQCEILMGDDCVSRVSEVTRYKRDLALWRKRQKSASESLPEPEPEKPWEKSSAHSLTQQLQEELEFEFAQTKANGKGLKTQLNTTVLSGELKTSHSSTRVILFRSHLGSVGNLLAHILQNRKSKLPLLFVGDLSASNHVSDSAVASKVKVTYAGCISHARRPFKRHLEDDPEACLEALDYFRALYHIEELIQDGRQQHKASMRQDTKNGSLSLWDDLKNLCLQMQERWSPATRLGEAIGYVLNNFKALTYYCKDLRIPPSNDLSERLLRYEKLMDRSSFGRETIEGRARYDIIRSFWQTCVFAKVDPAIALLEILITPENKVSENPEQYIPQNIALRLRKDTQRAALVEKILKTSDLRELVTYKTLDPNMPVNDEDV